MWTQQVCEITYTHAHMHASYTHTHGLIHFVCWQETKSRHQSSQFWGGKKQTSLVWKMTLIGRVKLLYFQKSIYYSKNNDLKVNLLCWEWIYLDCGVIILPGRLFFPTFCPFYIYASTNSVYSLLPTIKCVSIFIPQKYESPVRLPLLKNTHTHTDLEVTCLSYHKGHWHLWKRWQHPTLPLEGPPCFCLCPNTWNVQCQQRAKQAASWRSSFVG